MPSTWTLLHSMTCSTFELRRPQTPMNSNYRITLRCISYAANPSFARLPSKYDGIFEPGSMFAYRLNSHIAVVSTPSQTLAPRIHLKSLTVELKNGHFYWCFLMSRIAFWLHSYRLGFESFRSLSVKYVDHHYDVTSDSGGSLARG